MKICKDSRVMKSKLKEVPDTQCDVTAEYQAAEMMGGGPRTSWCLLVGEKPNMRASLRTVDLQWVSLEHWPLLYWSQFGTKPFLFCTTHESVIPIINVRDPQRVSLSSRPPRWNHLRRKVFDILHWSGFCTTTRVQTLNCKGESNE